MCASFSARAPSFDHPNYFYDLMPDDDNESPPQSVARAIPRRSRRSIPTQMRSRSTSPYVYSEDEDRMSLNWSSDGSQEWLPSASLSSGGSSGSSTRGTPIHPAHTRPKRAGWEQLDLEDSLIWPQIEEEVRSFLDKLRGPRVPGKPKDSKRVASTENEPTTSIPTGPIRPILSSKVLALQDLELRDAHLTDVLQYQRLSFHFPRIEFPTKSQCGELMEWILVDHDFPLPKLHFFRRSTFLMDPTEVEERFLRENFPAFTTDPLSPEENNVLIKRLKFVLKCLGWSSRDVMRNLTELAVATKRERRMLGRFILAAYVGRPLLHYRPLSQIVKAILILTHTHKVADIRQRDLAAIQSSISANKRKGWSALRKHFNVVRLVKDKQIKAANSRDMLQEEMKIVFLTVMRHINTTDLTNIDHKDVPMPLLAEVTNRNSFKRATFAKLLGRLKRLKNGVDAQSHFHNQRDILQAVIAQGATKPTEIDWRPIENGFPSYTRGCLMSVLYHSMKPGDGQTIREQWLASYQRRLQQTYKNSRFSATYNKDMEQLKEAYQWAKEAFEQDDKAKISIPKEDGSL
ncbi:hypothetical protein TCAL_07296 [Tigriopus californicus]|uniref:Uncharacterized protein n=1 Tax=Tigriopus californicus TaxID=6832 RepID=A0A553PPE7_TIGCA|nr:uncharacterized protein LOC131882315 isoform X1 [Tigriopus californicus]TRY79555.1 hypothetical protein TCAL_07296 [Tigriopus californicus]